MKKKIVKKTMSLVITIAIVLAMIPMTVFADSYYVALGNNISSEMIVETADNSFTFVMSNLFTTNVATTNYYYKTSENGNWETDDTLTSTYTYTFAEYGEQDIWFKCVQGEGTSDEVSAEVKITLKYYQGGATPSLNADGYYEIYSYEQLKSVTSLESSVKIKLMDNIDIYNTVMTSNSNTVTTNNLSDQAIDFLNGLTELDGNGYTITYTESEDSSLSMLKTNNYGASIYNLTIDCGNSINGIRANWGSTILDNVTIINEIEGGYGLRVGSDIGIAYVLIEGNTNISSIYSPINGYIFYYYNNIYDNIASANIYTDSSFLHIFESSNTEAIEPSTEILTGCIYIESDLTFDCDENEYGITIGAGGIADVTDHTISAGDGKSFLVQDGGLLDLYYNAIIDGVTVESGGAISLCSDDYDNTCPTVANLTLEPGASLINNTIDDYTIIYDGKEVVIPSGSTFVAPTVETAGNSTVNATVSSDLVSLLFTEDELISGDELEVILTVDDLDVEKIDEEEKVAIEEAITNLSDEGVFAFALDLTLEKYINGDLDDTITSTSSMITITIDIPEEYQAEGRVFSIVRVHNGVAQILDDLDDDPTTITFQTNLFSPYAVAYVDVIDDSKTDGSTDNSTDTSTSDSEDSDVISVGDGYSVSTGDSTLMLPLALLIVAFGGIAFILGRKYAYRQK